MAKQRISTVLLVLISLVLTACGGTVAEEEKPQTEPTAVVITE